MNAIALLFLVGLVFLAFEVLVPGIVMAAVGGLIMAGGCAVAFARFGAAGGFTAVAVAVALVALTFFLEFVVLPRTRAGRRMFLRSAVVATTQPPPAEVGVIGKTGEALTVLAPSGYVSIEGKRYEAYSLDGHVPKGAKLRVTGLDHLALKVSKI